MPTLVRDLADLDHQGLRRQRRIVESPQGTHLTVDGKGYLAFCSNDYLGLANHPAIAQAAARGLQQYGVGAGASHLISGHTAAHEALETELAAFVGLPRALYFSSGYMANTGVIPALARRGDDVFSDELNHACLIDGARLARADIKVYRHLDFAQLHHQLSASVAPRKLVISDAVFSMDGDITPLPQLVELCERFDAWLVLDDAHGFGVHGENGRGTLAHFRIASPNVIYMGTLGKAAGVSGAFVAGQLDVIEWLVQRARTYVFSTATPPLLACALRQSLQLIAEEEWRRERLRALIAQLRATLKTPRWRLMYSDTPIQPLIIGDNLEAMAAMQSLRARAIWVPAIRPPTVPAGTARLRISLSAAHSSADVERLVGALSEIGGG
jgi:8-amino-7-oxononanoate synthase